jgi:hypothetical protein
MAQIYEENLVIKLSILTKDGKSDPLITEEILNTVEQVVQQLAGNGVVVEVMV